VLGRATGKAQIVATLQLEHAADLVLAIAATTELAADDQAAPTRLPSSMCRIW